MAQTLTHPVTVDAFLAFEGERDTRYQLIDGAIVAMAPAHQIHGRLATRLASIISRHVRLPCEAIREAGIRLPENDTNFYVADVAYTCEQPETPWVEAPRLVIEVLSPSTELQDRGIKLGGYFQHSAIEEIVLVATRHRRVDVFRRSDSWAPEVVIGSGSVRLESVGVDLSLDELYAGLDL
ncbi:Uma2 family endonuclease [Zavarzinia sp. CC-PAN008]|uniref:Uma2 family endonuclease n=1 Tax=Zavarzinia sp. CC-PAN008 TaxID=3243332 RepID=UPI003F74403A